MATRRRPDSPTGKRQHSRRGQAEELVVGKFDPSLSPASLTPSRLVHLQRSAGNQAVTAYVQRESPWAVARRERLETFFFSRVAMATPRSLYKGKTDATFDGVNVERHWEWGLLTDDIAIVFQCGRQRFRFYNSVAFGKLRPWGILDRHGDIGGWVNDPLRDALTAIYRHWNDDRKFQAATRVVTAALKADVEEYRQREADFRRRRQGH